MKVSDLELLAGESNYFSEVYVPVECNHSTMNTRCTNKEDPSCPIFIMLLGQSLHTVLPGYLFQKAFDPYSHSIQGRVD